MLWRKRGPSSSRSRRLVFIGMRLIISTPPATTTSIAPDATAWAANSTDCWKDPHFRSRVTPGTEYGHPAARTAWRAILPDCSPTCCTHPAMTSSTAPGSTPVRSTRAVNTCARRSTGWASESTPPGRPLPNGVRTTSTTYAGRPRRPVISRQSDALSQSL